MPACSARFLHWIGLAAALALGACSPVATEQQRETGIVQSLGEPTDPVQVELRADPVQLTTAQRLTLTLRTRLKRGWIVESAAVAEALPENWKLIRDERTRDPSGPNEEWESSTRTIVVEPFLDGQFEFDALQVTATQTEEPRSTFSLVAEPIAIEVRSVLDPSADGSMAAVKSIVEPPQYTPWWLIGAGAGGLLLAIALIWFLVARRSAPREIKPTLAPAHEVALRQLDLLMESGLLERSAFKPFYIAASGILRQYIQDRFGLRAPERTTEEFVAESRISLSLTSADVQSLERFLLACDEVKFAAAQATRAQAEATADAVREFVQRTRKEDALVIVAANNAAENGKEGAHVL